MPRQSSALGLERVAVDPFTLDRRLVAVAPVPVGADADMLEIAAAFDVEERRTPVAMGLRGGFLGERIDALHVTTVVIVGIGAERPDGIGQRPRHLARLTRRVDGIAVVLADEYHRKPEQRGGV